MVGVQNLLASFCCALGKGTLQHLLLLGDLKKQLQNLVISLKLKTKKLNKKFNRTAISVLVSSKVGWGNCLTVSLRNAPCHFSSRQKDTCKCRDKNKEI